jgi:ferric-dicitrate binding protein FerR (iron transport regulator)
MTPACTMHRRKLEALASGHDDSRVREHVATCPACQTTLAELRAHVAAIATLAMPAPSAAARDHEIRRAIVDGLGSSAPAKRRWLAIGGGLAIAAAAAAAVLLVVSNRGERARSDAEVVISQGALSGPAATNAAVDVVGRDDAVVQLTDGTTLTLAPTTRVTRRNRAASRWELARGKVALAVTKRRPGEPLQVITAEALVEVVGTQFTVERQVIDDHLTTRVEVIEGVVRVTPRTGEPVTLRAGESWPSPPSPPPSAASIDAGVSASAPEPDAAIAIAPTPPPVKTPAPRFDPSTIRSTIRAGKLADARKLIEADRKTYRGSNATLAELGILAAEADLADRQTRRAIDKYLAVVRDFPTTAQAEQALFAAAQLAIDRPDAGYRPKALLEDYLATYPRGQFRKDVERLLGSLR